MIFSQEGKSYQSQTTSGIILRLERTSIHDGDGLRTVVYLKGCPLRCLWCSTPESQNHKPELGYNLSRCQSCYKCVNACPVNAIRPDPETAGVRINQDKCMHCFACVDACPSGALKAFGFEKSAEDIMREVEKDEIFYFHSGGGLTLTGGEPLAQANFAREILLACRNRGIHTALETAGYVPWENFEKVLPCLDLLYFDLKHMDPEQHQKLTGQRNELILDNLARIDGSNQNTDMIVRMPLMPGLNDSEENLLATAAFCKNLRHLKAIELLPYHRYGIETYAFLEKSYSLKNLKSPSPEYLNERIAKMQESGIKVSVYANTNQ